MVGLEPDLVLLAYFSSKLSLRQTQRVSIGISNCININSACSIASSAFAKSVGSKFAFAPEATTIQFSAWASTVINATPDGFFGSEKI